MGRKRKRKRTKKTAKIESDSDSQSSAEFSVNKPNEDDPCDCYYLDCPGCWNECEKCGSNKCSIFCRVGRTDTLFWKISR